MYGCRQAAAISAPMAPVDIGCMQRKAGPGYRVIAGDGPLSIMATGFTMIPMDGCGPPAMNGLPPGLPGGSMEGTIAGRPSAPEWISAFPSAVTGRLRTTGLSAPAIALPASMSAIIMFITCITQPLLIISRLLITSIGVQEEAAAIYADPLRIM
jgi:hypothetical protein